MASYHAIKKRLTRLEARVHPAPAPGWLAASGLFETEFGQWMLEAQPPERQAALREADHFTSLDVERAVQHPAIQAALAAHLAAWRKARGFESRAHHDVLAWN